MVPSDVVLVVEVATCAVVVLVGEASEPTGWLQE